MKVTKENATNVFSLTTIISFEKRKNPKSNPPANPNDTMLTNNNLL
jgi:hypothetical protein